MNLINLERVNKLLDNKCTKEENKLVNQLNEKSFLERLESINSHIGIFTLMFTFAIGLTSVLLKGFFYVYTQGKFDYWGISHTYINISNENTLYEILLFVAYSIIYITLNYIPFSILTSKNNRYKKLFQIVILFILTSCVLFSIVLIYEISINHNFIVDLQSAVQLYIPSILLTIMGYMPAFIMSISFGTKKDKEEIILFHKLINPFTLFAVIFGVSLYVIMAYVYGKYMADNQKSFKTIDNNHAVVYEDKEYFIISDYDVINETLVIDSAVQTFIKKENIKTETKIFTKAERKK